MKDKKRVTVFTPTYNRAYVLSRLYESLKCQTNYSFLWLIVDDGSNDNTEELINNWTKENKIEIRYYKQDNGGKQRAHNKGVELSDTELFICVDSDDILTNDAIDFFIRTWDSIENKKNISGIVALRGKDKKNPIGSNMPKNVQKCTLGNLYKRYKFWGDTALLLRTEILKQFPFHVVKGEKFIGESYVYLQIDQLFELYILNRIVYICDYLEDGYTKNVRRLIKNNPRGYVLLNKQAVHLSKSYRDKYLYSIKYIVGCILAREKRPINKAPDKCLALLATPVAVLFYYLQYRKIED